MLVDIKQQVKYILIYLFKSTKYLTFSCFLFISNDMFCSLSPHQINTYMTWTCRLHLALQPISSPCPSSRRSTPPCAALTGSWSSEGTTSTSSPAPCCLLRAGCCPSRTRCPRSCWTATTEQRARKDWVHGAEGHKQHKQQRNIWQHLAGGHLATTCSHTTHFLSASYLKNKPLRVFSFRKDAGLYWHCQKFKHGFDELCCCE